MAEGQALLQEFLDLVHAGDAAAVAMLCPIDDNQTYVDTIRHVAGDVDLQIDTSTAELVSSGVVYSDDLTGSAHGESVSYAHSGAAFEDGCIVTFLVQT